MRDGGDGAAREIKTLRLPVAGGDFNNVSSALRRWAKERGERKKMSESVIKWESRSERSRASSKALFEPRRGSAVR